MDNFQLQWVTMGHSKYSDLREINQLAGGEVMQNGDLVSYCFTILYKSNPKKNPHLRSGFKPSVRGRKKDGGAERVRTADLRLAKPALSQLSYCPNMS